MPVRGHGPRRVATTLALLMGVILLGGTPAFGQNGNGLDQDIIIQFQDLDGDGQVTPLERSIQVWWDVQQINEQHQLQADPDGPSLLDQLLIYAQALFGDLNSDGVVDGADILYMLEHAGDAEPMLTEGDLTKDGSVDGTDLLILMEAWGTNVELTDDELESLNKGATGPSE